MLLRDKKQINITGICANIAWSSNIDALGMELSFDFVDTETSHLPNFNLAVGDQIILMNDHKVLQYFILVTSTLSGRHTRSAVCYDRAWYLNKNETIIQFKKATATQAIQKLLDKFGVKHQIAKMSTIITKIYKDEVISDIILDILDQVKQKSSSTYRMEMKKDTLIIYKQTDMVINPMIRLSDNTKEFPVTKTISNPTNEQSIVDMKNSVIVVADGDDKTKIHAERKDATNIAKYGLLTEVVTVNEKEQAKARTIALNTLTELNRVNQTFACDLLGHDDLRAGRILELDDKDAGLVGKFIITAANHTLQKSIHRTSVELKEVS